MGDVTRHFSRHEFACRDDCGLSQPHPVLYLACESFRSYLGGPRTVVSSGTRCAPHNTAVGGSSDSQHLVQPTRGGHSTAADLVVEARTLDEMYEAAIAAEVTVGMETWRPFDRGGIGLYLYQDREAGRWRWFLHGDIREGRARWCYLNHESVKTTEIISVQYDLSRRPGWPKL